MTAELRALIFDVDGTLADTEEFHRRAFNAVFAAAGLVWWWNRGTYRDLLRIAGGRQRMRAYAEREDPLLAKRPEFDDLLVALHAAKTKRYDASLREQPLPLRPGIVRLFDEADAAGVRLAIATTTTAANLDALLEPQFGHAWRGRFAVVVSGSEITRLKPAPDVYLEVLRQLALDADACLAFEDSANGIRSAGAAGLAVIATPTWYSLAESLPPAFVSLPHLGDRDHPLPKDAPGAPYVDLACLREWHRHAIAHEPLGRAACY
ncbi:MAG TPA: HAD-IA family hydrolase [Rhodanobacteraceae bacterium]|jgi:HAD superfamily hydrolase (TIGR01509 family)|nr:HAD-IA family hydrolase [Rhodanobacteraceae bacterium]